MPPYTSTCHVAPAFSTKNRCFSRVSSRQMVENILSASVIGISYSNSGRTIPIRGPLMATVAMSPDIRTRTLRSLYTATNPSRMLTLRAADCRHASLATKNFRSISTALWRSCNFGRSEFSPTDTHVLMKVFNRAAAQVEYAANIQAWPDAANPPQLNHPCTVYDLCVGSCGFMMLAAI